MNAALHAACRAGFILKPPGQPVKVSTPTGPAPVAALGGERPW